MACSLQAAESVQHDGQLKARRLFLAAPVGSRRAANGQVRSFRPLRLPASGRSECPRRVETRRLAHLKLNVRSRAACWCPLMALSRPHSSLVFAMIGRNPSTYKTFAVPPAISHTSWDHGRQMDASTAAARRDEVSRTTEAGDAPSRLRSSVVALAGRHEMGDPEHGRLHGLTDAARRPEPWTGHPPRGMSVADVRPRASPRARRYPPRCRGTDIRERPRKRGGGRA